MSSKVNEFDGFIVLYQVWGHIPMSFYQVDYGSALENLHFSMRLKNPYEKAIGCILNHKMEVVYKTEVEPDE